MGVPEGRRIKGYQDEYVMIVKPSELKLKASGLVYIAHSIGKLFHAKKNSSLS